MNFDFPATSLVAFLLALVRAGAWATVAPPLNTRIIPVRIKTGIAVALAIAAVPHVKANEIPLDFWPFIMAVVTNVVIGLVLGFLAQLFIAAIQTAGAIIDVLGGFSISQALDPLLNFQTSVMGRVYQLIATTLLFVTGGHLLLIRGFLTSFEATTVVAPSINTIAHLLVRDIGVFAVASLEIAGPLVATLFLAELVMGVMSKAAPQMNVFMIEFPFKILLVLLLVGFAIPYLPGALDSLLGNALRDGANLMKSAP